jgi:hypothetical protein
MDIYKILERLGQVGNDATTAAADQLKKFNGIAESRRMSEADMEEGNEFTAARVAAIKSGKPSFTVGGKTYKVSGDTSDEKKVMEREFSNKDEFDSMAKPGDTYRTEKGTATKTAQGVKHERRHDDDEEDTDDEKLDKLKGPKLKGRPKGSKRAIGAKGPTGKSKLLNKSAIKDDIEEDLEEDSAKAARDIASISKIAKDCYGSKR